MPKLAIYVSKQDLRKLDPWRKKINFSQVFIKALRREIQERSRVVKAPKGKLTAAARYYQSMLADNSQALVDAGYRFGADQVLDCRLSPGSIQQIVSVNTDDATDVKTMAAAIGDATREIDKFARDQGINEEMQPTWKSSVYSGYIRGVADAWKKVCAQMRST